MTQLLAKVNAQPPSSAFTTLPVPQPGPLQTEGIFVPPIAAPGITGTSSAAPLSLQSCFPDVKAAVLAAIITHELKAVDLHKLNPTNCDKEMAYMFNRTTNQFGTYFWILAFHIDNALATDSL
ncbi:hypothetical protein E4T56_gene13137 [Termitomyces sp. T112]|nr:hypothetical protein E4T56_gene13137 [Termitomyces sp. T112]